MWVRTGGTESQLLTRRPAAEMRPASREQQRLPPPEQKWPAGRGGRASPLLARRAGLRLPVPAALKAAAATDRLGDPASQSTCCSTAGPERCLFKDNFLGPLGNRELPSGSSCPRRAPKPARDARRGSPGSGGATAGCAGGCGAEDPAAAACAGSVAGSPRKRQIPAPAAVAGEEVGKATGGLGRIGGLGTREPELLAPQLRAVGAHGVAGRARR